jgi:hypothetical protein
MKAEFCMRVKMDCPAITDKEMMMKLVKGIIKDMREYMDLEEVTDMELLNHTLVING